MRRIVFCSLLFLLSLAFLGCGEDRSQKESYWIPEIQEISPQIQMTVVKTYPMEKIGMCRVLLERGGMFYQGISSYCKFLPGEKPKVLTFFMMSSAGFAVRSYVLPPPENK